jgi:hypothetical protein
MTHLDGSQLEVASHNEGDWLACAPCQRLIERERYDEKGTDALCALHSPPRSALGARGPATPGPRAPHLWRKPPGGLQIW